jgi:type IV fimbrial biogenesis protein FimT
MRTASPLDDRGLTLVEVVVGLAVMAIILAASLPGFRSIMEGHRHSSSVGQLTSRMFLTRQMAVRDRTNYVMTVDAVNAQFAVFQDSNANGVQDAGENGNGPWALDTGVTLQNLDWAGNQMSFLPNGTTSQTGDLRLVGSKGHTKTIRVSSITGNVEVLP